MLTGCNVQLNRANIYGRSTVLVRCLAGALPGINVEEDQNRVYSEGVVCVDSIERGAVADICSTELQQLQASTTFEGKFEFCIQPLLSCELCPGTVPDSRTHSRLAAGCRCRTGEQCLTGDDAGSGCRRWPSAAAPCLRFASAQLSTTALPPFLYCRSQ